MTANQSRTDRTSIVAHYIISHTEPAQLGAVKLNKIMWRADVLAYRRFGRTITGQTSYIRMPYGPVPNGMAATLRRLAHEGKIVERAADVGVGLRREFVWLERQTAAGFEAEEVEILHQAIDEIAPLSAAAASDETHDVLWDEISNGAQIPIRAASVQPVPLEPEDFEWLESELRQTVS